ncbi:MAG: hydantoinase B/oxoprolinase family protein, partial [Burkholderiales bacterium]
RQIRVISPGTIFSVRSDSHTVGIPAGAFGGLDGRRARLMRNPGRSDEEVLFSKVARLELKVGDAIRIETPGGGGYGSPAERPTDRIAQDLASGRVSHGEAKRQYGADKLAAALEVTHPAPPPRDQDIL